VISLSRLSGIGGNNHGRNIKLIKADDGCDPVKAVAAVKKLIYVDKVFLLHGPACTSAILASKPIIARKEFLLLREVCGRHCESIGEGPF